MRKRLFNVFIWLCPMCNRRAEREDTRPAELIHFHCRRCHWGGFWDQIVKGEVLRQRVNITQEVDKPNAPV